jgi:hypothetical protein
MTEIKAKKAEEVAKTNFMNSLKKSDRVAYDNACRDEAATAKAAFEPGSAEAVLYDIFTRRDAGDDNRQGAESGTDLNLSSDNGRAGVDAWGGNG